MGGIQFFSTCKKRKEIQPWFIIVYIVGVFLLVLDGYEKDLKNLAMFNLASILVALLVLVRIILIRKKRR
ncbi:MAG: hypothetical protein V1870_00715 [Candidatus Aenigmatarchaeota archaeon]